MKSKAKDEPGPEPADDIGAALTRLDGALDEEDDPWQYRVLLQRVMGDVFHRLSRGELRAPGACLEHLGTLAWYVEKHLPDEGAPRQEAARDLHFVIETLRLAEDAMDLSRFETTLKNRTASATERAVLQALRNAHAHGRRHLRRADIVRESGVAVTEQRVGQILHALHARGLVVMTPSLARGGATVPFYALGDVGLEVCADLDIHPSPAPAAHDSPFGPPPVGAWKKPLTLPPPGPLPIVTFFSPQGGIGRTLMVAHAALLLAGSRRKRRTLLVNLDLGRTDLDRHLGVDVSACRGLSGLLADCRRAPDLKVFLRRALASKEFVVSPADNLTYLPAGRDEPDVRAASALLHEEVAAARSLGKRTPLATALREAIAGVSSLALVDARSGMDAVSYFAAVLLGDELALCGRPHTADLGPFERVVRAFSTDDPFRRGRGMDAIVPIITPAPASNDPALATWIREQWCPLMRAVSPEGPGPTAPPRQTVWAVPYEAELAYGVRLLVTRAGRWSDTTAPTAPIVRSFEDLLDRVSEGRDKQVPSPESVEHVVGALLPRLLGPEADGRALALGMLLDLCLQRPGEVLPHVPQTTQADLQRKIKNESRVRVRAKPALPALPGPAPLRRWPV